MTVVWTNVAKFGPCPLWASLPRYLGPNPCKKRRNISSIINNSAVHLLIVFKFGNVMTQTLKFWTSTSGQT